MYGTERRTSTDDKENEEEEEKQVLASLALFEGIIADQCQTKRKENQDANQLTETATLKIKETTRNQGTLQNNWGIH